jgi:Arc/MetJ family transcription regulator
MTTNLDIDQALLEKAVELSGKRSKKDAVTMALEEFIARRSQKGLIELFGKIDWDPDYDYKAERSRK